MYYDLKFPFRISAEAGMGKDSNGNPAEVYLLSTLGNCKSNPPTPEKYDEFHEAHRKGLADKLGLNIEWITCITPEEYEANATGEEMGFEFGGEKDNDC